MKFNFTEFLKAISLAIDFAELDYFNVNLNHSRRVAYISLVIANKFNLPKEDIEDLFTLALLHDNAVTISSVKTSNKPFEMMPEHCVIGEKIVQKLPLNKPRKNCVLYHHENYNGTGIFKKHSEEIPLFAQIIHFADTLDTTFKFENITPLDRETMKEFITINKNKLFPLEITEAFLESFDSERMWNDLSHYNKEKILDRVAPNIEYEKSWEEIKEICKIFTDIIDNKSRFTCRHTKGLASLVEKFCEFYKFSDEKTNKMIIAAYLHDIGKLYVPLEILDKPKGLTKLEFHEIKKHTYLGKLSIENIPGFEDITKWAFNHHEKLNGKGYPECLTEKDLDFESRIMAICDIYQALTEDRPYRKGLSKEEVFKIMNNMANRGEIDRDIMLDIFKITN